MFYIRHGTDSFTIIDCDLNAANAERIVRELKEQSKDKGIHRFMSTHPDEDHFGGIELLNDAMPIQNFYVVRNEAVKDRDTVSFQRYRALRDGTKAYWMERGCARKWLNESDETRSGAGIQVVWPDTTNRHFKEALAACNAGESFNNTSAVIRYSLTGGASFMWLGDLDKEFMEKIKDDIQLEKTTVVFAAHHGRDSGKIPDSWLKVLDPQFIVIGEAPSRTLNYYTGYDAITQNTAGDITFDLVGDKVHVYSSNPDYEHPDLTDARESRFDGYVGSFTVTDALAGLPASHRGS
jgi:beta-lactamase superfamily II metal-dependent hydrolase